MSKNQFYAWNFTTPPPPKKTVRQKRQKRWQQWPLHLYVAPDKWQDPNTRTRIRNSAQKMAPNDLRWWSLTSLFFVVVVFFASGVGFSLFPEIFYIISQWSCSASDYCGRCRIRTRDLCPRNLVRYQWATTSLQWATTSPTMSHHISPMSHHISPMSHHISSNS